MRRRSTSAPNYTIPKDPIYRLAYNLQKETYASDTIF